MRGVARGKAREAGVRVQVNPKARVEMKEGRRSRDMREGPRGGEGKGGRGGGKGGEGERHG